LKIPEQASLTGTHNSKGCEWLLLVMGSFLQRAITCAILDIFETLACIQTFPFFELIQNQPAGNPVAGEMVS
jgi:hypothetical protein